MHEIMSKYKDLKCKHPTIDHDLVMKFAKEMPEEFEEVIIEYAYGCHIGTEDFYEKAVDLLEWVGDKGEGAKWSVDDIVRLSGIDFDKKDYTEFDYAYVVNSFYADYCNVFTESSYYMKMARNYLEDLDPADKQNPSERAYRDAKERIKNYYEK